MKIRLIYTASLTTLAAGLLFACGNGDDDDMTATDAGTTTDAATGTDAATLAPTFTNVYATILGGVCSSCHGSSGGDGVTEGDLRMDSKADAFTNLVGAAAAGSSCGTSGETRVVASSSSTSLLWNKVNGTESCGSQMPLGKPKLSQAEIDLIAAWINAGAQNN